MSRFKATVCALLVLSSASIHADEGAMPLEEQLIRAGLPGDELPDQSSQEQVYAVHGRYSSLKFRHELGIGMARTFLGQEFVNTDTLSGSYRFHLNDRWSAGVSGMHFFNSYSQGATNLIEQKGIYPDVGFLKRAVDFTVGFNTFYGKMRPGFSTIVYFDQYLEIGPASLWPVGQRVTGGTGAAGFAFWLGRSTSVRLGVKDYVYHQVLRTGSGITHNVMAQLNVGVLLGGSPSR